MKYEYPFTYIEQDSRGNIMLQANYNSSCEIGELFVHCSYNNTTVKAQIEPFKRMNGDEWARIEKMVAWDNLNRLTSMAVSNG